MEEIGDPERQKLRETVAAVLQRLDQDADVRASLRAVDDAMGYVPPPAVALIAERTGAAPAEVFEVVRLSRVLDFRSRVRHRVAICRGPRCRSNGARQLVEQARAQLGIDFFESRPDGAVRLEPFDCFDECSRGPNARIDGLVHCGLDAEKLRELLRVLLHP